MKKTTNLIEKLAEYQLDVDSAKNIKGGDFFPIGGDILGTLSIGWGGGDPPPQ